MLLGHFSDVMTVRGVDFRITPGWASPGGDENVPRARGFVSDGEVRVVLRKRVSRFPQFWALFDLVTVRGVDFRISPGCASLGGDGNVPRACGFVSDGQVRVGMCK